MRGIHNHHPKIEKAGNGLNTILGILFIIACFGALFQGDKNGFKGTKQTHTEVSRDISENDYLMAISYAKAAPKMTLTEQQIQEMDRQASLQTREDDINRLKGKAKKRYYATLKQDAFTAGGF